MHKKRAAETVVQTVRNTRARVKLEAIQVEEALSESVKTEPKIKVEYEETVDAEVHVKSEGKISVKTEEKVTVTEQSADDSFEDPVTSSTFHDVDPQDLDPSQPKGWHLIYNQIAHMRRLTTTPVDAMGCGTMPNSIIPGLSVSSPRLYRFQLLIALMLSSQTKDEVNFAAMTKLNAYFVSKGYPGLCLEAVLGSTELEVNKCIDKVGFHRRKAMYIKKTCDMIQEKFDGDVPKTIEEIVSFPGVGPKMGFLLLQNGWNVNVGIGVDVHIHRMAQMWGWVSKTDKPEVTRKELEGWLPQKYWGDINPLLVGFGQTVCVPKASNCDVCFLANGLCKGVNRKLRNTNLTEARIAKLQKQRGDLSKLISLRLEKEIKDIKKEVKEIKEEVKKEAV